jgi:hypothetical protein
VNYFVDTEFMESGHLFPITPLSVGIVADDGREFYAVNAEADRTLANDWVKENVIPYLGVDLRADQSQDYWMRHVDIGHAVRAFVGDDDSPHFWGYYADYDWVVFAQLFGKMIDLPKGWPMYCRDIKQLAVEWGNPKLPPSGKSEHNALADARWNKVAYDFLMDKAKDFRIVGKDSGVARITDERLRQIKEEGWTPEQDDEHVRGQLAAAGTCYARHAAYQSRSFVPDYINGVPTEWPWAAEWWKPSPDPVRNLEKAGALMASEIDRLRRKAAR